MKQSILVPNSEFNNNTPKIKSVHPFGSKILVEVLNADEALGTKLYVKNDTQVDGAPQAYIVELGPQLVDSGLEVGQRIYWEGKGCPVNDPRSQNDRVRALLEIHNIKAIIEEDSNT